MRYVSIDIETLGLDPHNNDIVEFAAVVDDLSERKPVNELPTFHRFIYREDDLYQGSAYAIAMHHRIFEVLKSKKDWSVLATRTNLLLGFYNWLLDLGFSYDYNGVLRIQAAGKNFASFDRKFLEIQCNLGVNMTATSGVAADRPSILEVGHRVLDPGMLYFDPKIDRAVPSMADCQKRAGLGDIVAHTAMDDALMVVRLLRHKL